MLMSMEAFDEDMAGSAAIYPELAGKRVLITGIDGRRGIDIARVFAEHRCKLILQIDETSPEMDTVVELLAGHALDLNVRSGSLAETDHIVQYARSAAQVFGGLDVVVNLVSMSDEQAPAGEATPDDVEGLACRLLTRPCLVARIAANRMRLTHTEGLILNIALLPEASAAPAAGFAAVLKAAMVAMTRSEAQEWAKEGIRFNAVAPAVAASDDSEQIHGEVEVAALSLFLASGRGKNLSAHVFEASAR